MRLLDRYLLRSVLAPFCYCFFGFLAIWLVFDLSDNAPDFVEARVSLAKIGFYYLTQFPQIMVMSLPISLLLALLYALGRMSRSNEVIAMMTSGVGVIRVMGPLLLLGLAITAISLLLNYRMAPQSEAVKEQVFDQIVKGENKGTELRSHLYRDREARRTWFIGKFTLETAAFKKLHIMQQDAGTNVTEKYYARRANYDPVTKTWELRDGKTVTFDKEGRIADQEKWDERRFTGWSETPERIGSSVMDPQTMSVEELRDYLRVNADLPPLALAPYRTQLQYRWALPCQNFLAVLIAAPLGMVFSRRGVVTSVAAAIFTFAGMMFLSFLFLALGKGGRIGPEISAWLPVGAFLLVGVWLVFLRTTNRELRLWPQPEVAATGAPLHPSLKRVES